MRELAADRLTRMVWMVETVTSSRFIAAPYLARSVEMIWMALSIRPIEFRAVVAPVPATFVLAASRLVSDRPPKVKVIWSLEALFRPTWNVMALGAVATSGLPLKFEEPWMRDIS